MNSCTAGVIWPIENDAKKVGKWQNPWQMCTHLIVLGKSFQMNTDIAGLEKLSKCFAFLCL